MADIGKSWPVLIVCGGFLPLFLSVIWLLMIRHFVAAMPWVTVALFNVLIVSVTMFYYLKGQEMIYYHSFLSFFFFGGVGWWVTNICGSFGRKHLNLDFIFSSNSLNEV